MGKLSTPASAWMRFSMRNIDRIHFQGRCDRAHCAKAYNHSHPPLGELRPELEGYRRRKQTFYIDNGGRVQNLMTVNDLLLRLIQLPKDAIVGYEEETSWWSTPRRRRTLSTSWPASTTRRRRVSGKITS